MDNKVTSHTLRIDDNKELIVTVNQPLFIEDGYIHDKEGNIIMDINETYHAFYVTSHVTGVINETESFVFDTAEFIKYVRGFEGVDIRVFDSPLNSVNPFKIETAVCESLSFTVNNERYVILVNPNEHYTTAENGGIVKIKKYVGHETIFRVKKSVAAHTANGFFNRRDFLKTIKDKGLNCFTVS